MIIDQRTFQLFTYEFFLFGQIFLDLGILIIELLCLQSKSILVFIFFYDSRSIYSMMFEYNEKELNGYHTCTYFVLQSRNTKQCF